jgi:hypothetical protein
MKIICFLVSLTIFSCLFGAKELYAQNLVNQNSNEETIALKAFLDSIYGKKIISGQDFEVLDSNWLEIIYEASEGKTPALLGLDFMYSTPQRIADGSDPNAHTRRAIEWVNEMGGIVTFHWHWDAPKNVTRNRHQAFYTENTTFDLAYAMNNPESEDYKLLIRDMDLIAAQLKVLQDANVPVLWRPLHEAEGRWFWWGAKGGNACIALYRLMYDKFTNEHELNNLIWVWTSYGKERENWYPGDDVVDIIVWDYPNYNRTSGSWVQFQELFGGRDKLFGIGEDGRLFDPDLFSEQPWLYFLTWAYMIQPPHMPNGRNTPEWIFRVYNDPRVLTLDDLNPGPKVYPGKSRVIFDIKGEGRVDVDLDGSRSYTDNGEIISYVWTINGEVVAEGAVSTISLPVGEHIITLTITTSEGESKSGYLKIEVRKTSLSFRKPVSVSSTEANLGNVAANAVDGFENTRWSSVYSDPQWISVDLGQPYDINKVVIAWELASARDYRIDQSNDGNTWVPVVSRRNMAAGARTDVIENLEGGARYVRMYGVTRTTSWGYSIFEFEVYGTPNADAQPVADPNPVGSGFHTGVYLVGNYEQINIYPNPNAAGQQITIQTPQQFLHGTIHIYNVNGQLLLARPITKTPSVLDLPQDLSPGIYSVNLVHGQNTGIARLILLQ